MRSAGADPAAVAGVAVWAAFGGVVVGLLDAGIAVGRAADELGTAGARALWGLGGFALVLPALALGGAYGLARARLRDSPHVRGLRERARGGRGRAVALALPALLVLAAFAWGEERGVDWASIDLRPPAFLLVLAGMIVFGPRVAPLRGRGARWSLGVVTALATLGVAAGAPSLLAVEGVLPTILTQAAVLRPTFEFLRSRADGDGDGFPRAWCDQDCDCDDTDPQTNWAALDVPNNGVDEDCSGGDLVDPGDLVELDEAADEGDALASALASAGRSATPLAPPYNILLVTVDTMRADHLASYGYARSTTPVLDAFAAEHVRFSQVRAQGPATRYSLPAMLAGRYFSSLPREQRGKWCKMLKQNDMFAEHLQRAGYATRAIMSYFRFSAASGLGQGFDLWDTSIFMERSTTKYPSGDRVTEAGIAQLAELQDRSEPWLLWLHYFDPHSPYLEHEDQESFGDEAGDRYDGELAYTDRQIGRVFAELKARGMWDDLVVVVTSDHGEGFGGDADHGKRLHGHSLFDSEIRVPLMIRVPGVAPRAVDESVAVMDLAPTILELGGLPVPATMHGRSLLPWVLGDDPPHPPVYSERPGDIQPSLMDPFACREGECGPLSALVDWPYKVHWDIAHNRFRLYRLDTDPDETHDLSRSDRDRVMAMKAKIDLIRHRMGK